jgi:hypothetical protein
LSPFAAFPLSYKTIELSVAELEVRALHNIHRAASRAEITAIHLMHVNVVSVVRRSTGCILTFLNFNPKWLERDGNFTELASNASLLSGWITTQSMFTAEAR